MATQRRAGIIQFTVNGVRYDCKGNFTYNLGYPKREAIKGSSGITGYKETAQEAFIEGEITDNTTLDLATLVQADSQSVMLLLGNGKTIALRQSWFAADGTGNSEEGNIAVRYEGPGPAREVAA